MSTAAPSAAITCADVSFAWPDGASIFDGLDMNVLIRVAQAMDARKMSPILAKMVSTRAQQLTMQLADLNQTQANDATTSDPNALPQIVGQ